MAKTKTSTPKYQAHVRMVVHVYVPLKAQTLDEAAVEVKTFKSGAAFTALQDGDNLLDYETRVQVQGIALKDWE